MVMIDDVEALVRPVNHRDHVFAEKLSLFLLRFMLPPALALLLHLPHSNGHLGRAE
jgi:hypothetical protein